MRTISDKIGGSTHHWEKKKLFSGGIGKTDSLEKKKTGPLLHNTYKWPPDGLNFPVTTET